MKHGVKRDIEQNDTSLKKTRTSENIESSIAPEETATFDVWIRYEYGHGMKFVNGKFTIESPTPIQQFLSFNHPGQSEVRFMLFF